jgi:hypothetical protein
MDVVRRLPFLASIGALSALLCVAWMSSRTELTADAAAQLAAATAYYDSVIVRARDHQPRGARGDEITISLGYLERLRLGLGNPFRLVDFAARDTRLSVSNRRRVAWALLGRLRRGDVYEIDPAVLDGIGPWQTGDRAPSGNEHLALIERTIERADDPRDGELTIRLAYMIAATRGTVASTAPAIAAQVAAQVRDRALAMSDLHRLLRDTKRDQTDLLEEVRRRRAERSFAVEQPALAPLPSELQVAAMDRVADVVRVIDSLGTGTPQSPSHVARRSLLGPSFASRLTELGASLPPIAPIVVTVRTHRDALLPNGIIDPARPENRIVIRATNEETLAGTVAPFTERPDSTRRPTALTMLSAAVAVRALAQDQPWFPGDVGVTVAHLRTEHGLEAVTFDRSVPLAWRPYYLARLDGAILDMRSVLPIFLTTGLRFAFGTDPLPDSALAMHDPRTRTIRLSVWTSAGTLAHEMAHDLDWQAARKLYVDGRGYSTDRAIFEQRGSLATSIRDLAEARLLRPNPAVPASGVGTRPAELFARSADWFVATALARHGRTNGFLSAAQDPLLTGYAAGAPTAVGAVGTRALISALEQMTYLPDSVRDGFAEQWAGATAADPVLLVRRVTETPVSWRGVWRQPWMLSTTSLAPSGLDELACIIGAHTPEARARARLLDLAIEARARGAAMRRARARATADRPAWAHGLLGSPPWSSGEAERVVAVLRANLVDALATTPADQGLVAAAPAIFRSTASCRF